MWLCLALGLGLLCVGGAPARAVQLSPCQGNFEAVRGPSYRFALDPAGVPVPAVLAEELELGAQAIYDNWRSLLSAEPPFVVEINLRLLSDRAAFAALKSQLAPDLPDVTGFYAWEGNLAVALYESGNPTQSRRRALHEVSHVVTAAQTGAAPHWLAEGLAEFHEMVHSDSGGLVVSANGRHLRLLHAHSPPDLGVFLGLPAEAWHREDSQRLYAIAWSLVYFLMGSSEGRGALGQTLQQSTTHSCQAYSAASFLDRAWPGGLPDLQRQWHGWLARGEFAAIRLP